MIDNQKKQQIITFILGTNYFQIVKIQNGQTWAFEGNVVKNPDSCVLTPTRIHRSSARAACEFFFIILIVAPQKNLNKLAASRDCPGVGVGGGAGVKDHISVFMGSSPFPTLASSSPFPLP